MKGKLFLILSLLLLVNESKSQSFLEVGACIIDRLGFNVIFFVWDYLQVLFSLDEEKVKAYQESHPEIVEATLVCFKPPEPLIKTEAEKIINKLFNLTYKITIVTFDEEYVIDEGPPKITLKLKDKCDFDFEYTDTNVGYLKIEGGTIISQKGMDSTIEAEMEHIIKELTKFNIEEPYINVYRKLKDSIYEGTVYVKIYLDKIEYGFILNQTLNDKAVCEGSVIITMEFGDLPLPPAPDPAPVPVPIPEPAPVPKPWPFIPPVIDWDPVIDAIKNIGVPSIITFALFKILKSLLGGIISGPIGAFLGAAT